MPMPMLNQRFFVTCSRLFLRVYLVATSVILLATSIGTFPAFAENDVSNASEWDAYVVDLEKKVLSKWFPPPGIKAYKGVKVEMRIRKDGRLSRTSMTKSSQILVVNQAAVKAVKDAAPFKPFPDSLKGKDFATFEVKFDKYDIALKRRIVRKIDKFSKPDKDDQDKHSKISF
jgi:TonB family protein